MGSGFGVNIGDVGEEPMFQLPGGRRIGPRDRHGTGRTIDRAEQLKRTVAQTFEHN